MLANIENVVNLVNFAKGVRFFFAKFKAHKHRVSVFLPQLLISFRGILRF